MFQVLLKLCEHSHDGLCKTLVRGSQHLPYPMLESVIVFPLICAEVSLMLRMQVAFDHVLDIESVKPGVLDIT